MDDLARLQIKVSSLEASVADTRLKNLTKSGHKAERATNGLTTAMTRFAGPAVVAAAAVATLTKAVSVAREFDVLNAQLITATGSAENASVAFKAIQDFAANTPYDLAQVTDGFTKLVNLGLTPSESALTSYGNTASAMGKDLNQLIEAVADAATGEFERLKEFGIKTKSQGDNVTFTFRGIATTVGKNAAEIESYLTKLGENEFAGAMQQRMDTLDGALSNLGDEWDKLFLNISNQGIGAAMEDSVRTAITSLGEFNSALASGEVAARLDAITGKFDGFAEDFSDTIIFMTGLWDQFLGTEAGQGLEGATEETIDFIIDAFKNLPENLRSVVQLMTVELATLVSSGLAYGKAFSEVLGSEFAKLVMKASAYGEAIGEAINPFSDGTFDLEARLTALDKIGEEMATKAFDRAAKESNVANEARRLSIIAIMDERNAALKSYDDQMTAADKLREAFDKQLAARRASKEDVLGKFKVGGEDGASDGASDTQRKALDKLIKSLRTEEEVIQESYTNRLAIILANTEEGSNAQHELKKRLDEQFAEEAVGELTSPDSYEEQLEQLEQYYQQRRELIIGNTELAEDQRTELELKLTEQRNQKLALLQSQHDSAIFSSSAQLFDSLAGIAHNFAGEQSGIYKAMFVASKAFAIADAIIKIQQGIAAAASLPFPANIPAIGATVAATSSVISTISGTNIPSFEGGGYTGNSPRTGGEDGKGGFLAMVHGNEIVTDLTKVNKSVSNGTSSSSVNLNVTVENYTSSSIEVQQLSETDIRIIARDTAERVVSEKTSSVIASEINDPNSRVSSALNRNLKSERRRA